MISELMISDFSLRISSAGTFRSGFAAYMLGWMKQAAGNNFFPSARLATDRNQNASEEPHALFRGWFVLW
jgi:hypothetical protein